MNLHIDALKGDIAESILLPGDPMRAKFVAESLLENSVCYNKTRGMLGYTGDYKGKQVSIQGTGMGMPSAGIYAYELINQFGVKKLIRVGTCGAILEHLEVGQVILVVGASGDSSMNEQQFGRASYASTSDYDLLVKADKAAEKLGIKTIKGNIFSTDIFYSDDESRYDVWAKHGVLAVEMESQVLFTIAARYGVKAMTILTVSDNIITGAAASSQEREQSYMDMMHIALDIA